MAGDEDVAEERAIHGSDRPLFCSGEQIVKPSLLVLELALSRSNRQNPKIQRRGVVMAGSISPQTITPDSIPPVSPGVQQEPLRPPRARIDSIDLLRGIVMVIMMLDHTRDFIHSGALLFDPLDLSKTTLWLLCFSRAAEHICASRAAKASGRLPALPLRLVRRPSFWRPRSPAPPP